MSPASTTLAISSSEDFELIELRRRAPQRGQLGRERLQSDAYLEQLVHAARLPPRPLAPFEPHGLGVGARAHERAAAVANLDDAQRLEQLDRLADRAAADRELLAQLPLAGQLIAGLQPALLDRAAKLAPARAP